MTNVFWLRVSYRLNIILHYFVIAVFFYGKTKIFILCGWSCELPMANVVLVILKIRSNLCFSMLCRSTMIHLIFQVSRQRNEPTILDKQYYLLYDQKSLYSYAFDHPHKRKEILKSWEYKERQCAPPAPSIFSFTNYLRFRLMILI